MPKSVQVTVEVPNGISAEDKALAQRRAEEAAVLALWEAASLSTREAAAELGLSYHDFLDLLHDRGIPVAQSGIHSDVVDSLVAGVKQRSK